MTLLLSSRLPISALVLTTTLTVLTGCNNMSPNVQNSSATATIIPSTIMQPATKIQADLSPAVQTVIGDYASSGYDKRAQGYDWVGVMISANDNESINIIVRSRSDIKKPTCNFEGTATLVGQDNAHGVIFTSVVDDGLIFLQFKDNKLTVGSEDNSGLNYYCSGGATLAGDYQKLAGNLELS